jgi:hypothetical protein
MITHCPICRYSLEGLPDKHRCPECGFEYDKRGIQFDPRDRGKIKGDVWLKVVLISLVLAMAIWSGRLANLAFPLALGLFVLLRSMRFASQAEKMTTIVSPGKIEFISSRQLQVTVDLADVHAERVMTTGAIRFYRGAQLLFTIRANQYYTRKTTKQLARVLQAQLGDRFKFVLSHSIPAELPP